MKNYFIQWKITIARLQTWLTLLHFTSDIKFTHTVKNYPCFCWFPSCWNQLINRSNNIVMLFNEIKWSQLKNGRWQANAPTGTEASHQLTIWGTSPLTIQGLPVIGSFSEDKHLWRLQSLTGFVRRESFFWTFIWNTICELAPQFVWEFSLLNPFYNQTISLLFSSYRSKKQIED